jgi:hypothetical protein
VSEVSNNSRPVAAIQAIGSMVQGVPALETIILVSAGTAADSAAGTASMFCKSPMLLYLRASVEPATS